MTTSETPRLFLRPRSAGDFNPCLAIDRDLQMIRYVGPLWSNDEKHVAFLRERIETVYPAGLGYWSIFPRQDRSGFLGWVMLCPTAVAGAEVEIG